MQYLTQHPPLGGHPKRRGLCFACLSVVNSCRETPGPIPNPEAKPAHADGTATGRLWESKSPPTPNNNKQQNNETRREGDGQPTVSFSFYVLLVSSPWPKSKFLMWRTRFSKEFLDSKASISSWLIWIACIRMIWSAWIFSLTACLMRSVTRYGSSRKR